MEKSNFLECSIQLDTNLPMLLANAESLQIIYANKAATELFELHSEHITNRLVTDFIVTENKIFESPLCSTVNSLIMTGKEKLLKSSITFIKIFITGVEHICVYLNLFSDPKAETITESPKDIFFELLFENNPLPCIIFSRETGLILYANIASKALYGYSADEFSNMEIDSICPEIKIPGYFINLEKKTPGRYHKTIAYHQTKNKNILEIEMHIRPFYLGSQPAAISIMKDVTKRINENTEINQNRFPPANQEGARKTEINNYSSDSLSALKSIILSNMSHELRTPLVGILGYSDILKNEVVNSELKQMADVIHKSGEKLLTDLNMVLNLSAIEIGLTHLFYAEADICSIILKVIKKFKPEAEKKHLYLNFTSIYTELVLRTDKELLHDALYYIVDNAIKFTNSGGVTIELDYLPGVSGASYTISISDTGLGISEEQQQFIFEAFRQISEGSNRTFGGLGIGLTVARKIITMFGGKISFESYRNRGTKFILSFPTGE